MSTAAATESVSITTDELKPKAKPRKPRKPPSEWKKTPRYSSVKAQEPDFITKTELAHHLGCHISTLTDWIEDGSIPPPHSRPGDKHPIWLRRHYKEFVRTGKWPREAFRD